MDLLLLASTIGESAKRLATKRSWIRKTLKDVMKLLNKVNEEVLGDDHERDTFRFYATVAEIDEYEVIKLAYSYPQGFYLLKVYEDHSLGRIDVDELPCSVIRDILSNLESALHSIRNLIEEQIEENTRILEMFSWLEKAFASRQIHLDEQEVKHV